MEWEAKPGLMVEDMMDYLQLITKRAMEYTTGLTEEDTKGGGILINNTDWEYTRGQVKVRQRTLTVKMMVQY